MRKRIIFILATFLLLIGPMVSCTTVDIKNTGETIDGTAIKEFKYKGHTYVMFGNCITHAGHCKCH